MAAVAGVPAPAASVQQAQVAVVEAASAAAELVVVLVVLVEMVLVEGAVAVLRRAACQKWRFPTANRAILMRMRGQ